MLSLLTKTSLSAAVVAALLPAQQPQSLLFTTLGNELTANPTFPASLVAIDPEDVVQVTPNQANPFSAEKYAPDMAWLTVIGDEDADTDHWEATLTGNIDGLHAIDNSNTNMRDVYFSPRVTVGGAVSGAPILPGDVARVGMLGAVFHLLTEAQIRSAFNIPAAEAINVDAITIGQIPVQGGPYNGRLLVYLSLESNHTGTFRDLAGNIVSNQAPDGAILAIPIAAVAEPVAGVAAGSGVLVLAEVGVDALVNNLNLVKPGGGQVTTVGDLDGLELAPGGGFFATQTGQYENLIFVGENLLSATIASTFGGGSFAMINGVQMNGGAGGGSQVGLQATLGTLNGLILTKAEPWHIVLETPNPVINFPPGGMVQVDVGGAIPGAPTFLLYAPAPKGAATVLPTFAFANAGFPELIAPPNVLGALAIAANGTTSWNAPLMAMAAPPVDIAFQVAAWNGASWVLSTPMTVELR